MNSATAEMPTEYGEAGDAQLPSRRWQICNESASGGFELDKCEPLPKVEMNIVCEIQRIFEISP